MIVAMAESPLTTLTRWEESGAHWRVYRLTGGEAVVELLSCLGEPVDQLRSTDPELLDYLERRPASEQDDQTRSPGPPRASPR
jgi:hypothetical protein